jgi:hypothetical protein
MTTFAPTSRRRTRRAALRADPLVVALAIAMVAGLGLLWAVAPGPPAPPVDPAPRVALVVDAGADHAAALAAARAAAERTERTTRAVVEVRVPATAAEAATDVRYFAARGFDRVVAVGPRAGAAARVVRADAAGTAIATPAALPAAMR